MVFPHTWVGTFMQYTRGLFDSIHLNLYPIMRGGGGLCHVKSDQCYWFLFVRIKNKTIISDDSKTPACDDIWDHTKHGVISSQRSILNLNIDLFLLETSCLVDQEKNSVHI